MASNSVLLVRPRVTIPSPSAPDFNEKVKALLDIREGLTRDQGQRFVTMEQLASMGLVPSNYSTNVTLGGVDSVATGGADTMPPHSPTNLQITVLLTSHTLSWTNPTDDDLSHIEVWRSVVQDRSQAKLKAIVTKPLESVSLNDADPDQAYYYWIRAVDRAGNYSLWNPSNQQGGELVPAQTQAVIDDITTRLTGQITESHLYGALGSRIDLIDGPSTLAGSVAARVAQEASDRAAAILSEASARSTADQALQTQINTLTAASSGDFQDLIAALQTETTARIDADSAEATSRETLATQLRGSYTGSNVNLLTSGLLYNERIARSTADSALSSSITALQSTVNSNTAAITAEQTARANADSAMASDISTLQTSVSNNSAAITTEQTARINGDNALASSVTSLQTTVNGHTASIQAHTSVINGMSAQYYLKTDVNGYVAGFGLYNDGATSEFIITADKFGVVTPGAPSGATAKMPFVVGNVNGVSTVGIDGQLVVDGSIAAKSIVAGSITSDKIGAGEIHADNIAADAINGDHIQATSLIALAEGGKMVVGNNNIVLDSTTDEIIIAPDNGAIVGTMDLTGLDHCRLAEGDLQFLYWNGTEHVLYNSVKRIESGANKANNVQVTLPGIWKNIPKIIVSPHSLQTFSKDYVGYNQKINCEAQNVALASDGTVTFKPIASLVLSDGIAFSNPGISVYRKHDPAGGTWYSLDSEVWQSSPETVSIYLSGSLSAVYKSLTSGLIYPSYFYMKVEILIDGVSKYIGETGKIGAMTVPWSCTISGLTQGLHDVQMRTWYMHDKSVDQDIAVTGICDNMSCYQGTFSQLASGTLSYIAIGE